MWVRFKERSDLTSESQVHTKIYGNLGASLSHPAGSRCLCMYPYPIAFPPNATMSCVMLEDTAGRDAVDIP